LPPGRFANLLTAAGKKQQCLRRGLRSGNAVYETGSKLINRALEDARGELGRQERNITPVDLASDDLRHPAQAPLSNHAARRRNQIDDIATAFGASLEEAAAPRPPTAAPKPSPTRSPTLTPSTRASRMSSHSSRRMRASSRRAA
jgi:hypothetical protein